MTNTLEFPDGVRLTQLDEIPGPADRREELWARVQSAHITPGYVLTESGQSTFSHYAEINVHASCIWEVFCDLCRTVLGPSATFFASMKDDDPIEICWGDKEKLISVLSKYNYQLSHDGFIQFGLGWAENGVLNEIFVAPAKHFKVWLNDTNEFRAAMTRYNLAEAKSLEFMDQYPRVTTALRDSPSIFREQPDLFRQIENEIVGSKTQ